MAKRALFCLGRVTATPGALEAFLTACEQPQTYLLRHMTGDWDKVSKADAQEIDVSAKDDYRILSAYTLPSSVRIWIITEADRSATTILLPEEH